MPFKKGKKKKRETGIEPETEKLMKSLYLSEYLYLSAVRQFI